MSSSSSASSTVARQSTVGVDGSDREAASSDEAGLFVRGRLLGPAFLFELRARFFDIRVAVMLRSWLGGLYSVCVRLLAAVQL